MVNKIQAVVIFLDNHYFKVIKFNQVGEDIQPNELYYVFQLKEGKGEENVKN